MSAKNMKMLCDMLAIEGCKAKTTTATPRCCGETAKNECIEQIRRACYYIIIFIILLSPALKLFQWKQAKRTTSVVVNY